MTDQEQYYRQALEALEQGVAVFRPDRSLVAANTRYFDMFDLPSALRQPGISYEAILLHEIMSGHFVGDDERQFDTKALLERRLASSTIPGSSSTAEYEHFSGVVYQIKHRVAADGSLVVLASSLSQDGGCDVWFQEMVRCDDVTGLYNRVFFRSIVGDHIVRMDGTSLCGAVVVVRLDNRDDISESVGSVMNDRLIRGLAERLSLFAMAEQEGDAEILVARLGDVEFGLWVPHLAHDDAVRLLSEALVDDLQNRPLILDRDVEVDLQVSIGISRYPTDSREANELIRFAELAMANSRAEMNRRYCVFTSDLKASSDEQGLIRHDLRVAAERGELRAFYQPKVDLRTGQLVGMEALIRWQHPTRGMVSPGLFVPSAERSGMIAEISAWIMQEACRQTRRWLDAGLPNLVVAVNLSTIQFRRHSVISTIAAALEESGLPPEHLEIEITESVLLAEDELVCETFRWLKDLGIGIAVDDFGTGYSSLSYLKRFPVDKVKIDASFVRHCHRDDNDAAIARSVIKLAHSLNMKVVGEGIEEMRHVAFLAREGCDEGQGYLFGRPLPAEDFEALVRRTPVFALEDPVDA